MRNWTAEEGRKERGRDGKREGGRKEKWKEGRIEGIREEGGKRKGRKVERDKGVDL